MEFQYFGHKTKIIIHITSKRFQFGTWHEIVDQRVEFDKFIKFFPKP